MVKVYKIGGNNSQSFLKNFKPNCLVVVTHPGCGHCKMLKPTLDKVYNDMKKIYTGDAEIFDVHGDAAQEAKSSLPLLEAVDGYPTLLISKQKDITKPIIYSGDRSKEDIIKFMTDNLSIKKNSRQNRSKKSRKLKKKRKYSKKTRKINK